MRIIVTTHREYWMPNDPLYLPVQVGATRKPTLSSVLHRDDEGENISAKNSTFCELTGLYWTWKNLDEDVYGLCHYRRYLGDKCFWKKKKERLITEEQIKDLLKRADVILPQKRHYWIETRENQYIHAHHWEDLLCTENVLKEKAPDYLKAWNRMLKARSGHICNMFIMRKHHFMEYCQWLFDILFEVESRLDISEYSDYDRRVFGFLGERLLDVWIGTKQLKYIEVPMITLEKQNWVRKGMLFLQRKICGKNKIEKKRCSKH